MQCVNGHLLYRIRALKDFDDVKKVISGGYSEKQSNLFHKGNCWVYDHARFFQNARVFGNAKVKGYFVDVYGDAKIYDNTCVSGYAHISDETVICGNARVGGYAKISDGAYICDESRVFDDAVVCGALISGDSYIHSAASLTEDDQIDSEAIPRLGSKDDYYHHEYYDDCEYDYNFENANQAA
ncbi:hypothetical protein [Candidatus Bartonella washoeensis]|uniref:UDP-3-O-[3-hydroxymyristoyl] glucosamine N-acyltransferase n=1 Tax=Cardidatus Bartonella washoeensis 085-0475 TaxID=1094564 RepID=J1JPQ9_9HYPH|nr:hypothetical protein [Bartonella washoeensis]EJF86340.1 hypothetical protein MCW_00236 [Bartonella washoeensis 085-0475]